MWWWFGGKINLFVHFVFYCIFAEMAIYSVIAALSAFFCFSFLCTLCFRGYKYPQKITRREQVQ
jgi:hypothetical protein